MFVPKFDSIPLCHESHNIMPCCCLNNFIFDLKNLWYLLIMWYIHLYVTLVSWYLLQRADRALRFFTQFPEYLTAIFMVTNINISVWIELKLAPPIILILFRKSYKNALFSSSAKREFVSGFPPSWPAFSTQRFHCSSSSHHKNIEIVAYINKSINAVNLYLPSSLVPEMATVGS